VKRNTNREKNIDRFNQDVSESGGYAYTGSERYSSRVANGRLSETVTQMVCIKGKTLIDIGCGDGTYTLELMPLQPKAILGVDAAENAIQAARRKAGELSRGAGDPIIDFSVLDVYKLSQLSRTFDVAVVRGLLHHLYDPEAAIRSIAGIAKEIVVIEPNGYNPILKVIERFSAYHVAHEEKSYAPHRLEAWFLASGAHVEKGFYAGFVPMFCPEGMARVLKKLEPWVERTPGLRALGCAVCVLKLRGRAA